jgi:hypothetical protein
LHLRYRERPGRGASADPTKSGRNWWAVAQLLAALASSAPSACRRHSRRGRRCSSALERRGACRPTRGSGRGRHMARRGRRNTLAPLPSLADPPPIWLANRRAARAEWTDPEDDRPTAAGTAPWLDAALRHRGTAPGGVDWSRPAADSLQGQPPTSGRRSPPWRRPLLSPTQDWDRIREQKGRAPWEWRPRSMRRRHPADSHGATSAYAGHTAPPRLSRRC